MPFQTRMGTGRKQGPKRNFQILSPLDFLAEFTQHILAKGCQREMIEKILKHCGLSRSPAARAPPDPDGLVRKLDYVDIDTYLATF